LPCVCLRYQTLHSRCYSFLPFLISTLYLPCVCLRYQTLHSRVIPFFLFSSLRQVLRSSAATAKAAAAGDAQSERVIAVAAATDAVRAEADERVRKLGVDNEHKRLLLHECKLSMQRFVRNEAAFKLQLSEYAREVKRLKRLAAGTGADAAAAAALSKADGDGDGEKGIDSGAAAAAARVLQQLDSNANGGGGGGGDGGDDGTSVKKAGGKAAKPAAKPAPKPDRETRRAQRKAKSLAATGGGADKENEEMTLV
jgi:hypothetical protein